MSLAEKESLLSYPTVDIFEKSVREIFLTQNSLFHFSTQKHFQTKLHF